MKISEKEAREKIEKFCDKNISHEKFLPDNPASEELCSAEEFMDELRRLIKKDQGGRR